MSSLESEIIINHIIGEYDRETRMQSCARCGLILVDHRGSALAGIGFAPGAVNTLGRCTISGAHPDGVPCTEQDREAA